MVLVLLPVLIGAAVAGIASGTQYGDYAAAKMPQYGADEYPESVRELAPSDGDYHDRSPNVPASPDYKYEEDLNFRMVNVKNNEDLRKTTKKLPRVQRLDVNPLLQQSNQYNTNKVISKFKQTFRPRARSRNSKRNPDNNKNNLRSGRIKSNDFIDKENDFMEEDRYHDHLDNDKVYVRATSEKVVRRKPRDRSVTIPEVETEELDDDDDDEGKNDQEDVKDAEYSMSEESVPGERSGETQQLESNEDSVIVKRPLPQRGDDDIIARLEAKKLDQKTEDEYQDYYDMKRVNNIKKKITVLYRRTKARATGTTTSRRVRVWTYRRSYVLDRYGTPKSDEAGIPARTTTIRMTTKTKSKKKTQSKTTTIKATSSPTSPTTKTERLIKPTTKSRSMTLNKENVKSELSLAEKSRISILKKAQLKESLMNKSVTLKPPVLMQVSQRMNTMVMVEPQKKGANLQLMGSLGNGMSDTPERLARAKMIMRRKLVAGARNIHDLTDKWDEVICDYIDVSQLDYAKLNLISTPLFFVTLIFHLYR